MMNCEFINMTNYKDHGKYINWEFVNMINTINCKFAIILTYC